MMILCGRMAAVTYKAIRSVRMRIGSDGNLVISAPKGVKKSYLENFVREHLDWIEKQEGKVRAVPDRSVFDGAIHRILGEDVVLHIVPAPLNSVTRMGDHLFIGTKDTDEAYCEALLENYLKKEAKVLFTGIAEEFYPLFAAKGAKMPAISVRRMTSRWGSCTPSKGTIRFNLYLYEAPMDCVESVVLHEMTHLLYADHGKGFYDFLIRHMPDYRARKKKLEESVKI